MRFIHGIYLFLLLAACIACEKDDPALTDSEQLLGNWIDPVSIDTNMRYQRSHYLKSNTYGFSFGTMGLFVERRIAGFCATPPVTYFDYEGSWTSNDSIIHITVPYWGGITQYEWKLISVDEDFLTVHKLNEENISE